MASVTESQFANDAALYTTSLSNLTTLSEEFITSASWWGLTVTIQKTKTIIVNSHGDQCTGLPLEGRGSIGFVHHCTYLDGVLADDGLLNSEVTSCLAKASRDFGCLLDSIFMTTTLSNDIKRQVYKSMVLSILFYGAETWPLKAVHVLRLNHFHRSCELSILGIGSGKGSSPVQSWRRDWVKRSASVFCFASIVCSG